MSACRSSSIWHDGDSPYVSDNLGRERRCCHHQQIIGTQRLMSRFWPPYVATADCCAAASCWRTAEGLTGVLGIETPQSSSQPTKKSLFDSLDHPWQRKAVQCDACFRLLRLGSRRVQWHVECWMSTLKVAKLPQNYIFIVGILEVLSCWMWPALLQLIYKVRQKFENTHQWNESCF